MNDNTIVRSSRVSEAEFNLTKQFIDLLNLNVEGDFTITSDDSLEPLSCGGKNLAYVERYSSFKYVPSSMPIFRPFKNEKHANIIISVFDQSGEIDYDSLEIEEYEVNGIPKYRGWLTKDQKRVDGSLVKISPSIPILKMSIIASVMMDESEHDEYMKNLMTLLGKDKKDEKS